MEPTGVASRKDRAIAKIVRFLALAIYRDIAVYWMEPPRLTGPQLMVANHFGGLADGIVLLYALPRRPHVIASDRIWKVPIIGRIMRWIGGIPVHQPSDRSSPTSNAEMFGACFEALRSGSQLLIFPEGVTRDEPSIASVKTGAARIVLGAHASGVGGIVVTPVGSHYEDKAALRSRVVVIAGRSIAIDGFDTAAAEEGDEPDRERVTELTARIDDALRLAAPDYEGWDEARQLLRAADIAIRTSGDDSTGEAAHETQVRLANALSDRPPDQRAAIRRAVVEYDARRDRLGVGDVDLTDRSNVRSRVALRLLVGLVLLPYALVGAVIHLAPYIVVKAVGRIPVAPAVHATIKPLVAVVAFGATWVAVAWWAAEAWGLVGAAAALLLMPFYLASTIIVADRLALLARVRDRRRESPGADIVGARDAVVEAVWAR